MSWMPDAVQKYSKVLDVNSAALSILSILMQTSGLCALILMIIASSLGNARFRVLSKETSACLPNASTKMKKYWKGPNGGVMGPHRSPWSHSRGGGSLLGSF